MTDRTSPVSATLKPCPFCGGPARLKQGCPGCWFVQCDRCMAASNDVGYEHAIDIWNTRDHAQRPSVLEVVDREYYEGVIKELREQVESLTTALTTARNRVHYLGVAHSDYRHFEANEKIYLPQIDGALSDTSTDREGK
jgi:hypothetical protein